MEKKTLRDVMLNLEQESKQPKDLEDYKKTVETYLISNCNYTEADAKELIEMYEEDFPQFYQEGWSKALVATAMEMGY